MTKSQNNSRLFRYYAREALRENGSRTDFFEKTSLHSAGFSGEGKTLYNLHVDGRETTIYVSDVKTSARFLVKILNLQKNGNQT